MSTTSNEPTPNAGMADHAEDQKTWYSEQTTSLVRTLGLSAFAAAWLLAGALGTNADDANMTLDLLRDKTTLATTAAFALTALALDFLQMLLSALTWGTWSWTVRSLSDDQLDDTDPQIRVAFWIARWSGMFTHLDGSQPNASDPAGDLHRLRLKIVSRDPVTAKALATRGANGLVTLPGVVCFVLKCASLIVAYIALLTYVWSALT